MKLKTRIIAFILMLLTVFYAIPVSAFAESAFSEKSGKKGELSSAEVQAGLNSLAVNAELVANNIVDGLSKGWNYIVDWWNSR